MTKIVQIKGSNGSGKTTIVKQLIRLSSDVHLLEAKGFGGKTVATIMDDLGWIAIGGYPEESAMGGCDRIRTIDNIKWAIDEAYDHSPGYWIVFEGMMVSTIKSTFYQFLLDMRQRSRADWMEDIDPLFVILRTTAERCVERIEGRGTKRAGLKVDNVRAKCEMVVRHAKTYDQAYVRWLDVDDVPLDRMVWEFLDLVGEDSDWRYALDPLYR